jgi:diketogulonate reductase-like aldo/keto reductase
LGGDHLDLFLIHWPGSKGLKPEDIRHKALRKESWLAMEKLFQDGKYV